MGTAVLKDILMDWQAYELDDSIYVRKGAEPTLDSEVTVLPFDPLRGRDFEGQSYEQPHPSREEHAPGHH